jgi:hypothetical protein
MGSNSQDAAASASSVPGRVQPSSSRLLPGTLQQQSLQQQPVLGAAAMRNRIQRHSLTNIDDSRGAAAQQDIADNKQLLINDFSSHFEGLASVSESTSAAKPQLKPLQKVKKHQSKMYVSIWFVSDFNSTVHVRNMCTVRYWHPCDLICLCFVVGLVLLYTVKLTIGDGTVWIRRKLLIIL